ncbi:hypothetical protein [Bacteroides heparinolyticus]|uniref:hypothetical protein n=1 Tax=Prevotella heparinolytica TaxID=28113 RepID=UPI00104ED9BD|nr:hypothetical protein [Bacteroides heparinolyticus]
MELNKEIEKLETDYNLLESEAGFGLLILHVLLDNQSIIPVPCPKTWQHRMQTIQVLSLSLI